MWWPSQLKPGYHRQLIGWSLTPSWPHFVCFDVPFNSLSNRFNSVYDRLDLHWQLLSFEAMKVRCKRIILLWFYSPCLISFVLFCHLCCFIFGTTLCYVFNHLYFWVFGKINEDEGPRSQPKVSWRVWVLAVKLNWTFKPRRCHENGNSLMNSNQWRHHSLKINRGSCDRPNLAIDWT